MLPESPTAPVAPDTVAGIGGPPGGGRVTWEAPRVDRYCNSFPHVNPPGACGRVDASSTSHAWDGSPGVSDAPPGPNHVNVAAVTPTSNTAFGIPSLGSRVATRHRLAHVLGGLPAVLGSVQHERLRPLTGVGAEREGLREAPRRQLHLDIYALAGTDARR